MDIYKYFRRVPNKEDAGKCNIPFETYRCKLCNTPLQLQFAGSRFIGEKSFDEQNYDLLKRHLEFHILENKLKTVGIDIENRESM